MDQRVQSLMFMMMMIIMMKTKQQEVRSGSLTAYFHRSLNTYIIIIIIIIIIVINFMQCIYNYISETGHVSTVYSVAAVLYLQFVLHVMLYCP